MSFVYAIKYIRECEGHAHKCTHIYSDTKITLDGTSKLNWGEKTRSAIKRYGPIKLMFLRPKCCISFAGNNIALAHQLFETLCEMKEFSEEDLLHHALKIHTDHPPDKIEFIICLADENDETEIICIKEHTMQRNCSRAWIGSQDAFWTLRKYQSEKPELSDQYLTAFMYAMQHCGDETVGGFPIYVGFDTEEKEFVYQERLETAAERAQEVLPGMQIKLGGSAEEGAYTAHYRASNEDVVIDIEQAHITIFYTKKYRLHNKDVSNPYTKHFLLPIVVETDSGKVRLV